MFSNPQSVVDVRLKQALVAMECLLPVSNISSFVYQPRLLFPACDANMKQREVGGVRLGGNV